VRDDQPRPAPDRNLALDLLRVTEAAAMAGGRWVGRGAKNDADQAAVTAMRTMMSTVAMDGVVVIGEGEKDQAPMLYNGERVGDGTGAAYDVAVDPIDGTTLAAKGMTNAVAVLAIAPRGSMFDPSAVFYMDKLVTGPAAAALMDLNAPVADNIRAVAKAKGSSVNDITVCILDRPRHNDLVADVRAAGARIQFISDGDVAGALMACSPDSGVDLLLGIGGTPEGVIAACAVKSLGGVILARLTPRSDGERDAAAAAGLDLKVVLSTDDLVNSDDAFFAVTGITDGEVVRGVRYGAGTAVTDSIVMRAKSGTVRHVTATHRLDRLAGYSAVDYEHPTPAMVAGIHREG